MFASRPVINALLKKKAPLSITQAAAYSTGGFHNERLAIGNREWVGYGINGQPHYADRIDFPAPAVRFKEFTGELIALREKEKGDWKKLTIDEKKKLYRASFCQTLVEEEAPTDQWKYILGFTLILASLSLWVVYFSQKFLYRPKPHTVSEEHRAATFRTMLDMKVGHLSGISSKWDYEKDDWKK